MTNVFQHYAMSGQEFAEAIGVRMVGRLIKLADASHSGISSAQAIKKLMLGAAKVR